MFDALANGFRQAKNRLAGLTELTEQNIDTALREVRLSLLEADVELGVVKVFLARVKEKALGEVVRVKAKRNDGQTVAVTAGDQFTKICYDELVAFMSPGDSPAITYADASEKRPTGIMMVGLQGSGKTTTCAKLARLLQKQGKKPLLVAADMQRPAAVEQLQVLGKSVDVPVFNIPGDSPLEICRKAIDEAKKTGRDVIIFDTAGRLAIDEKLMNELASIKDAVQPQNILLVVDAMIGQDAVKVSKGFHEKLDLTGVVLTKLDGDARGGAALSIKSVTGVAIKFIGTGERTEDFDTFYPDRLASRILGMGDVVSLVEKAQESIDEREAEKMADALRKADFNLEDFLAQLQQVKKLGSVQNLIGMMPGMSGVKVGDIPEQQMQRTEAIIKSMTLQERRKPDILNGSRRQRIAAGAGVKIVEVNQILKQFQQMQKMMKMMKGGGMKKMMRQMEAMKGKGGFPGM